MIFLTKFRLNQKNTLIKKTLAYFLKKIDNFSITLSYSLSVKLA